MSIHSARVLLAALCALPCATTTSQAQSTVLSWAGALESSSGVTTPEAALGAPDGQPASFFGASCQAIYRDFGRDSGTLQGSTSLHDTLALEGLLGVSAACLQRADFVVFEHNSSVGYSVESSTWTFGDGAQSVAIPHDCSNPSSAFPPPGQAGVKSLPGIAPDSFASFFGFPSPWVGGEIQALLFDLPGIDVLSPAFGVTVNAQGGAGCFSPDPDAMGLIHSSVGVSFCTPAVANSTGAPAGLHAAGSPVAADGLLLLVAEGLPTGQFGYLLASRTTGSLTPPGSQGVLCLSGNIGRFNAASQIIQGPLDALHVDLDSIPVNPPTAVQPGDTWHFQCWYRDINPGPTSNFSDAVSVTFS